MTKIGVNWDYNILSRIKFPNCILGYFCKFPFKLKMKVKSPTTLQLLKYTN